MKEAIGRSLQEPSRAIDNMTFWTSLIHRVYRNGSQLNGK